MSSLKSILDHVPHAPGVYRFLNDRGEVLYVGKAIDLKKRVSSYFRKAKNTSIRLQKLVEKTMDIQFTVVNSELEALILETNLIKSFSPRYNILMKDDKNYVYLKITVKEDFPRVMIVRQLEKDGSRYFGPKTSASELRRILKILKKIFPYRHCALKIQFKEQEASATRSGKPGEGGGPFKVLVGNKVIPYPCIDYHIKRCVGPCVGTVTPEAYRTIIDQLIAFFEGKTESLFADLTTQMQEAVAARQFERAALLRDRLMEIQNVMQTQRVSSPDGASRDVIGLAVEGGYGYVTLLVFREGKLLNLENFTLNALDVESGGELEESEILSSFLKQYYERAVDFPKEVLLPDFLEEASILEEWISALSQVSVKFLAPQRGKNKGLLELAEDNARSFAKQSQVRWMSNEGKSLDSTLEALKNVLNLPQMPKRIECYDISHLGGEDTVGSMVVFEQGFPKKSDYRHFKLRTVQEKIDDYAAMEEVLTRRLRYLKPIATELIRVKKKERTEVENLLPSLSEEEGVERNYSRLFILRKAKKIVGIIEWKMLEKDSSEIRLLWVDPKEEAVVSDLVYGVLRKQKKGKMFVWSDPEQVDRYGALGFNEAKEVPSFVPLREGRLMVYRFLKEGTDTSFSKKPHLMVIDGGKGQLQVVKTVLDRFQLKIPVIGLAKREEEIFFPGQSDPLVLSHSSSELQLLQRLRDEAHRFAITYQRNLRGKSMFA